MDIRSLRYFVETVRLNSFTQAAEALHVTQSTVSKMVHNLEYETGGQLLVRDGRKMALTDTGRVMYARGQAILASIGDLKREISDTQYLRAGSLTVGMPPMINVLFTPVLKAFREKYPEVAVTLREERGLAIERLVAAGELEVGITVMPCDPALDFVAVEVARYPMWALAKVGTFLDNRTTIKFEQLRDMQLVLLSDDSARPGVWQTYSAGTVTANPPPWRSRSCRWRRPTTASCIWRRWASGIGWWKWLRPVSAWRSCRN